MYENKKYYWYLFFTKVMVWKTNFDKVDYEEGNFNRNINYIILLKSIDCSHLKCN